MKRAGEEGTMQGTARSESSLLPWMLAQAAGGIAAALGSGAVVWTLAHASTGERSFPWPALILALAGFVVFVGARGALAARAAAAATPPASSVRASALSWSLLLVLAAGFLVFVHLTTR